MSIAIKVEVGAEVKVDKEHLTDEQRAVFEKTFPSHDIILEVVKLNDDYTCDVLFRGFNVTITVPLNSLLSNFNGLTMPEYFYLRDFLRYEEFTIKSFAHTIQNIIEARHYVCNEMLTLAYAETFVIGCNGFTNLKDVSKYVTEYFDSFIKKMIMK